jgi:hypothetical protein
MVGNHNTRSAVAGVLLYVGVAGALSSHAEPGTSAKALADAWMGRDASELLLQLRVDGGRVRIDEDPTSLETRYTWTTIKPAWTEKVYVSGGEYLHNESTGNGYRPVYAPIYYDNVDHPPEHRCDITYIADSEGVVRRWTARGPECDADIVGPKQRR